MYDPDWLKAHYDDYGIKEWERWDRNLVQQVKFDVHLHYLRDNLRPDDRVLEIGAGPGRFTVELAKMVKSIVVGDISPVQLQLNRDSAHRLGFTEAVERWVECDMCDMRACFPDAAFDAVVCYGGPLSYVFDQRATALREMLRVLKPDGLLFLGVMSLWGSIHESLPGVLKLDWTLNQRIIASGNLSPDTPEAGAHYMHMYRAAELRSVLEEAGIAIEALSASDCLSATWADLLLSVRSDPQAWQELLQMEVKACREPGCLDMGTHLIAVGRKPA